jgi:hypothetical protein
VPDLATILADGEYLRRQGDVLTGGTPAQSRFVPVVIFNGESNSGGTVPVGALTTEELAVRPAVQIFDNTGLASFQSLDIGTNNNVGHDGYPNSQHVGWENGLAHSVEDGDWWNDTVYLIKTGQGGSVISHWDETDPYYVTFLARTRPALALLRAQGLVPVIYVWYTQGINDGNNSTPEGQWMEATQEYHARLRRELGYVPIFMTKLIDVGAQYNDSIDLMVAEDPMLFAIDVTGASTSDPHHWDYAGMNLLADRFVAQSVVFGQHENYIMRQIGALSGQAFVDPPTVLPSIIRSPTAVTFTEGSSGATFNARLSIAPATDVTLTVTVVGGNAVRSPATLTFTPSNWNVDQVVTITSPNDGIAAGDRVATVTLSSAGQVAASVTVGVSIVDAGVGATAPVNSVLPAVTGATTLGATLTCSTGTWSQSPTGYTYQWRRNGTPISGATANTRVITSDDQGQSLSCVVTATNAQGSSNATSNTVAVPAAGGGSPFGATLAPATWGDFVETDSPSAGALRLLTNGSGRGGMAAQTINFAQPWEIEVEFPDNAGSTGVVVSIVPVDDADYTWGDSAKLVAVGIHNSGGGGANVFSNISQSAINLELEGSMPAFPGRVKIVKNGTGVDFYKADGASAYPGTPFASRAGVLTSYQTGTGYVKAIFALPAAPQTIIVRGLSS